MITIDEAIDAAKGMKNVSNGGSACFDFGDVVLVKYSQGIRWLREGERCRSCEESVMKKINHKVLEGVHTPRHLAIKRVVEGDYDICYVLQEKCKGINCASISKRGVSYEGAYDSLKKVYDIPFSQYQKLVLDGCALLDMGYEGKNKNLFYDEETGFWYIDFLDDDLDMAFDSNDPKKIFQTIRYVVPSPLRIASSVSWDAKLEEEEAKNLHVLENAIRAKTFLAYRAIPNFSRYEKIYLMSEADDFKKFLEQEKIVDYDLFSLDEEDYKVYDELYETVVSHLVSKIVEEGLEFWNVEVNDIRNEGGLFGLPKIWEIHRDNLLRREDFDEPYDYEREVNKTFTWNMLGDIRKRLEEYSSSDAARKFITDMDQKIDKNKER